MSTFNIIIHSFKHISDQEVSFHKDKLNIYNIILKHYEQILNHYCSIPVKPGIKDYIP